MVQSRLSHEYLTPLHRSVWSLGLLLLACFVFPQATAAQTTEAKPVARLITGSIADSRTRRIVQPAATFAMVNKTLSPSLDEATAIERRAFEQTNRVRHQHGLQPFVWDAQLCRFARTHSQNMGQLRFFSHSTPDGHRLRDRAQNAGIRFVVIAENIAYNMGYDDPGGFAVERWMVSPGHRANILHAGFQAMAVGTFVAPDGSVYLTQTFVTRSSQ
jgi:uncharacterized protein YkwD